MKVKLNGFHVEMMDEKVLENDVFVDFEYERIDERELNFFIRSFIGRDLHHHRFCLKSEYFIDLEKEKFTDEEKMLKTIIRSLVDQMVETIMFVDSLTQKEERLN